MKTLLVLPRFEPNTNPPLGLAYIAAAMRNAGLEVEILDPTFEGFGYAVRRLKNADYGLLGFGCFTMNINVSLKLAGIAKSANPKCKTVFGGVHPTVMPEPTLREKQVDVVVVGEGEQTFVELARRIAGSKSLRGLKGTLYKERGRIVRNPPRALPDNIDELPFPARDLVPMEKYLSASLGRSAWAVRQPSTSIISTRGCPFQCTYCASKVMFGRRARFRSAKNIIGEIQHLIDTYNIRGLVFIDDTLTLRPKVVTEMCDEMIRRKWDLEWICNARVDTVSPELFRKMRLAGCRAIAMGIESGDQWVLDNILKKGIKLGQVRKAFAWAKAAGLITDAYFMLGSPGESLRQMRNTIEFAKHSDIDYANFNVTRPLPGTEMHDLAERYGNLSVTSWDDYEFTAKPIFSSNEWSPDEVMQLKKQAYREFYFNPRYILRQLLSIRGWSDIVRAWHGLQMVLRVS